MQFCNATNSNKSWVPVGNNRALGTPPTWCPARPILWSAVAILPGDPTWITISTEPISIPISRLDEETTALNSPLFSFCSTSNRIFLSIEPWCPSTPSTCIALSFWTSTSVILLVLAKTRVVLWALINSLITSTFLSKISFIAVLLNRSVGRRISRSNLLEPEIWAIVTGVLELESEDTKNSATVFNGSIVAEIPIRWTGLEIEWSRCANVNAKWVPLFVGTKECISSTIKYLRSCNIGRNREEPIANANDSGVVIRMWGGFFNIFCRSAWEVSPVLNPTTISCEPLGRKPSLISLNGSIRFFWISLANALIGEI